MEQKNGHVSEGMIVYLILALSGGCMDAYSYLCRGEVFANAQTGNMLLVGVHLAEQDIPGAMKYLLPVAAFAIGIIVSDIVQFRIERSGIHWRIIAVVIELVILFAVCHISLSNNALANALTSLACGIQVEAFRKVLGNSVATTMCIGNLRSGISNLDLFMKTKERDYLRKSSVYFRIILFFVGGAIIESALIRIFAAKALYFSVIMLALALVLMLKKPADY